MLSALLLPHLIGCMPGLPKYSPTSTTLPYYSVSVDLVIVVPHVTTNSPTIITNGDTLELWGNFNFWAEPATNALITNNTAIFFVQYDAPGSVRYHLRPPTGIPPIFDADGNYFTYEIPLTYTNGGANNGGTITITNAGHWHT